MSTSLSPSLLKLLAFVSGGRCAFPGCGIQLWVEDGQGNPLKTRAEAAHIRGERPGAARYDASMTDDQRNSFGNLVYLCPNHHDEIDKNEAQWPTPAVERMKQNHEATIQAALGATMGEVSSADLEVVVRGVHTTTFSEPTDFSITDPSTKMQTNQLSPSTGALLRLGLAASRDVERYLARMSEVDPFVGERLKAAFQAEYRSRHESGLRGDALFEAMREFATRGFAELRLQATALAVLAYLFEACEVFEK